ncbi:MAG: TetR family transcriptional regulator [Pseudonocardiaceae bacterium]
MTSRDSAATRARLLAAAQHEFAAHGIGGARVDRIAKKAGVNKERIYGHFGSKEKLFEAVIADALDTHTAALGLPTDDPAEYVGRIYDFHRKHPQLLRLLTWEALYYGAEGLLDEQRRAAHYAEKVAALAKTLGVESDRKTATTLLALIGLAAWPTAVPQLTRLILGQSTDGDSDVRGYLVELARKVIAPDQVPMPSPPPTGSTAPVT